MPNKYIAIEGVIGVGKTTLVRLLMPEFGAQPLLELFEENPFLADFYGDRARYAFQTQIVFLLSRYRQQHRVIPEMLRTSSVLSDYMFAKDRIFAHANLSGDELDTYDRLHSILGETVAVPDLIIYLHADLPVLLQRIAIRDRSFERNIDPDYLDLLRRAYEDYFASYPHAPVLTINTNELDYVHDPAALQEITQRIRNALGTGTHQPALLGDAGRATLTGAETALAAEQTAATPPAQPGMATADPLMSMLALQEQMGLLASGLMGGGAEMSGPLRAALANLREMARGLGVDVDAEAPVDGEAR